MKQTPPEKNGQQNTWPIKKFVEVKEWPLEEYVEGQNISWTLDA